MSQRIYGHKRGVAKVAYPKRLFCSSKNISLPAKVDLRPGMPDVYDQGDLGSCTANAIAGALEYDIIKAKKAAIVPSRLFIYFNERRKEGTITVDSGAMISDGIEVVRTLGLCPESSSNKLLAKSCWPYDISKFARQPSSVCYAFGKLNKATAAHSVIQDINQLKQALVAGFPVTVGISVYDSFESDAVASTGFVPMPQDSESCLGGHAILISGYDDSLIANGNTGHFIVRNSWGSSWGDKGYCYIPYAYILDPNLSCEFYTITQVSLHY